MPAQVSYSKVIGFVLGLLLPLSILAQDTITFSKTYDFNFGYEAGTSILSLNDGYLICGSGYATEYDNWRALKLLRTDLEGNETWSKVYGTEKKAYYPGWYGGMDTVMGGVYYSR